MLPLRDMGLAFAGVLLDHIHAEATCESYEKRGVTMEITRHIAQYWLTNLVKESWDNQLEQVLLFGFSYRKLWQSKKGL